MTYYFRNTTLKMWDEEELERRLKGQPENLKTGDVSLILSWRHQIVNEIARKLGIIAKPKTVNESYYVGKTTYFTHDDVRELNRRYKASKANAKLVAQAN